MESTYKASSGLQEQSFSGFYSPTARFTPTQSPATSRTKRRHFNIESSLADSKFKSPAASSILKQSGEDTRAVPRRAIPRSPYNEGEGIKLSELASPTTGTARSIERRPFSSVAPASTKSVRFNQDDTEFQTPLNETQRERPSSRYFRASTNDQSRRSFNNRSESRSTTNFSSDTPYSREYVDQLRRRHKNELNELEGKYKLLSQEYEEAKRNTKDNTGSLNRQLEEQAMRHVDQLEKIKKESDLHADKRTKALDYDNKLLKSQLKEREQLVAELTRKTEIINAELRDKEYESQSTASDLTSRLRLLEERAEAQAVAHEGEKKRLKASYGNLINEMSTEIKLLYERINQEMSAKERKIGDLERSLADTNRQRQAKQAESVAEIETLDEHNKYQKRLLEENKAEILRLNEQLDEKKKLVFMLESRTELQKSHRSLRTDSKYASYQTSVDSRAEGSYRQRAAPM